MRNYTIAATVRHSWRYIEHELAAMNMSDAFSMFVYWLGINELIAIEAISELDITETGESE